MKITLLRYGGILTVKKRGEMEINLSEADLRAIKEASQPGEALPGSVRDGVVYSLEYENGSFFINWEKIPAKYRSVMDRLKDKLVVDRQDKL